MYILRITVPFNEQQSHPPPLLPVLLLPAVTACPALECSSPPWLRLRGSKCRGRWTSSRLSRQLAPRGLTWCPLQWAGGRQGWAVGASKSNYMALLLCLSLTAATGTRVFATMYVVTNTVYVHYSWSAWQPHIYILIHFRYLNNKRVQ